MEDKVKFLGVIPARKGSKRIPNKNRKLVGGKPLIYWSIKYALESELIDKVIVTTDDNRIKVYCEEFDVIIDDRPSELSKDTTTLTEVMQYIVNKYPCENVVILRPTSPIRINEIIDTCINCYTKFHLNSLMTGFTNKERPWFTHEDEPSQLVSGWFQGDGCVEITSSDILKDGKTYGKHRAQYSTSEIYNHEIDTELDFIIIEAIMKHVGMI